MFLLSLTLHPCNKLGATTFPRTSVNAEYLYSPRTPQGYAGHQLAIRYAFAGELTDLYQLAMGILIFRFWFKPDLTI